MIRSCVAFGAAFAGLCAFAVPAGAHGFGQRYDLPLPLWYYLTGAGAVVALTFVIAVLVLRGGSRPGPELRIALPPLFLHVATLLLRSFGLLAFILVVAAGLFGEQGDWDSNLLPVSVWVLWWVGFAYVSALFGNLWPVLDPWRTIGDFFARKPRLAWPEHLSAWPSVFLLFVFACAELAWTENAVPFKLATLVIFYSVLSWTGMAVFGVEAWRNNADPFANVFSLFARFAPFDVSGNTLILRPFGAGLAGRQPPPVASCAFIILMISTVAFDGVSDTPLWDSLTGAAMQLLYSGGLVQVFGYAAAGSLVKLAGLAVVPLAFAGVYLAVCRLAGRLSGEAAGITARRYCLTLIPIAIAYHLAHYLSYLLIQGQAVIPLLSDPLNLGWNLFGTSGREIDIGVIDMKFVWLFAVGAIVAGHVAAVILAHLEALQTHGGALSRRAMIAQIPLLIFMVAYTMLSLWILSQPIVAG